MRFKVNMGYDSRNREKNRYFPTLEAATAVVSDYFRRTGIVLSIIEITKPQATPPSIKQNKE